MKFEVKGSSVNPYVVDTEEITCTCPNWKYKCRHHPIDSESRLCKHLIQVFNDHPELKPGWMIRQESSLNEATTTDPDGKVRYPRSIFDIYVSDIKSVLGQYSTEIKKYEFCGSYRRLAEKVADIDVLLVVNEGQTAEELFDYLENILEYKKILRGPVRASYIIDGYIQVDFKVVPEGAWAFSLCHFTGSKVENIRLRRRASDMGYSLSEYGFKDSTGKVDTFGITTEQGVYEFLKLPYVEPWNR